MKINFGPDWSEFLTLLISHRVKFLLVGGHAVAGHGEPRFTEDLDVFVDATLANAKRLRAALLDFGFGDSIPPARELATRGKIWMLGRKPWRIDVLTSIDGVEFAEAWKGRAAADFGGLSLPVIGVAELIKNKKASGRPKDLADVSRLEALQAQAQAGGRRSHHRPRGRQRKKQPGES